MDIFQEENIDCNFLVRAYQHRFLEPPISFDTCVAEYVWWPLLWLCSSVFIRRLFDDPQHSGFCRGWRVRVSGPQQWHHNINHLVPHGGQRSVAIIAIASEVLLSVIIWRLGGLKDLMIGLDFHLKWIKQDLFE